MRQVSDKLEVPHHRIAALAAYCKHDRAAAKPAMDFSSETPEKMAAPPKVEMECVKTEVKTEQESLADGLQRLIKAASEKSEKGISIAELVLQLKFPETEIRAALTTSFDRGDFFDTGDDCVACP